MTLSIKHAFNSAVADSGNTALVQPSNWNAEHNITLAAGKVMGRDTSGAGAVQELPIAVDSSGNVGIGTTSPGFKLTVAGTVDAAYVSGTSNLLIRNLSGVNRIDSYNDPITANYPLQILGSPVTFYTADTERMRIDSSGNLLVGTTTATVSPTSGVSIQMFTSSANIGVGHATGTSSGNTYSTFAYAGTQIGSISQNGTTGVLFNITSDQRLKTNIVNAPSASSIIGAIQIRSFDWKSDNSHNRYGVIAQELVQVAPEAVHIPLDEADMMGVDYSKLVPIMVKAIQELSAKVTALESK